MWNVGTHRKLVLSLPLLVTLSIGIGAGLVSIAVWPEPASAARAAKRTLKSAASAPACGNDEHFSTEIKAKRAGRVRRFGQPWIFDLARNDRLDHAQFSASQLRVKAVTRGSEALDPATIFLVLDGIRGNPVDSSAVSIETTETKTLHHPRFDSRAQDRRAKGAKTRPTPAATTRVISFDLKKFTFGAERTADDIVRAAAVDDHPLSVRIGQMTSADGETYEKHGITAQALLLSGLSSSECAPSGGELDTTAPLTQLLSQSANGITSVDSQSIAFNADEPSLFSCRHNLGEWRDCSSPNEDRRGEWHASALADGDQQLSFRAQDASGNLSAVTTVQWRIDTQAPKLTLGAVTPEGPVVASSSLDLEFSVNEAAQTTCSLDGGEATVCSSPLTLNSLTDGSHRLEITARDLANLQSAPLVHEWTVQMEPPTVSITHLNPAADVVASSSITFGFAGAPGTKKYLCLLDEAAPAVCQSPTTYSELGDGVHSFAVRAVDALGRAGAPATHSWRIDSAPPVVFILSASPARSPTSTDSMEITFAASEPAAFTCALDGEAPRACASPVFYADLPDGSHRVSIRAVDAAGNASLSPLDHAWALDTVVPEIQIISIEPTGHLIRSTSVRMSFISTEAARFECRLNDGSFSACPSTYELTDLIDGMYRVEARAIDLALNAGPIVVHEFTVDTKAPVPSIDSVTPLASVSNHTAKTFTFSGPAPDTVGFECALNDAAFQACSSPLTYDDLQEGSYTFHLRAYDAAGNISGQTLSYDWTVDLTGPETFFTRITPQDSPSDSRSFVFEFASDEGLTAFECSPNGAAFSPCTSPFALNNLADGSHSFQVRAMDPAGNIDSSPVVYDWAVDTTPLKVSNLHVSSIAKASAVVNWSLNRPGSAKVEYTNLTTGQMFTTPSHSERSTSHSVALSGLSANTVYSVVAVSVSETGQVARSKPLNFRTMP